MNLQLNKIFSTAITSVHVEAIKAYTALEN